MTIEKTVADNTLTLALEGRLDTTTAPQLEEAFKADIGSNTSFVLDLAKVGYLSSAGLRVILSAQKAMTARNGKMVVKNVAEAIMEVFEITGFVDILTIE